MQAPKLSLSPSQWAPIDTLIDPESLSEARKQLYRGVQLVSAFSRAILPEEEDDSHAFLYWEAGQQQLISRPIGYNQPHHIGLHLPSFELRSFNRKGEVINRLALQGTKKAEALAWLSNETRCPLKKLQLPYDMPYIPLAAEDSYQLPEPHCMEFFCAAFNNGSLILGPLAVEFPDTEIPGCKPETLDYLCVMTTQVNIETRDFHQLHLGLSLGDADYPLPYFFVSMWPEPDTSTLPYLEGPGQWVTFPWVGLMLQAETLAQYPPAHQQQVAESFIMKGIDCCQEVMAG
ncbi:MAG: hypothetical protein D6730_08605 [Bacteroidetes bacterium]|nr:MAG: hypothetical protein D6730_08605 [Bacteroidota bacterium]